MNPVSLIRWRDPKSDPPAVGPAGCSDVILFDVGMTGTIIVPGLYYRDNGWVRLGQRETLGYTPKAWAELPAFNPNGATLDDLADGLAWLDDLWNWHVADHADLSHKEVATINAEIDRLRALLPEAPDAG